MADIELVIKISEEMYNMACNYPEMVLAGYSQCIKNGTPLDDLRAEIDGLTYYWCEVNPRSVIDDCLAIIDKYKGE